MELNPIRLWYSHINVAKLYVCLALIAAVTSYLAHIHNILQVLSGIAYSSQHQTTLVLYASIDYLRGDRHFSVLSIK